jgi:alginate O-acetyltransferase complex protein AlgI
MNFGSLPYFAFIIAIVAAIHLMPGRRSREWLLLAASLAFYAAWDVRFIPLLLGVSAASWFLGAVVSRPPSATRSWLMGLGIAALMSPLVLFKYTNFLIENLRALGLAHGGGPALDLILPVGISFFTFQAVGYVCDVAAGRIKTEPSLTRYTVYMTFFPHLAAGPIVRAADFLPQLNAAWRAPSAQVIGYSLARFLWGLFKKLCIADHLAASVVDPVFGNLGLASGPTIVLASFAFSLQIYADFSGYSDIAIASARLMGFRLRENFDAPYLATSPSAFWRRWHMSLSLLIRDYVYIPLGGNRGMSKARAAGNALIAMLLCGVWHGAAWTFVAWGGLHGLGLVMARWLPAPATRWVRLLAGWALTQSLVIFGWFIFRATSLDDLVVAADRLAAGGWKPTDVSPAFLMILATDAALIFGEQAIIMLWRSGRLPAGLRLRVSGVPVQIGLATATLAALVLLADPYNGASPFLYFQF